MKTAKGLFGYAVIIIVCMVLLTGCGGEGSYEEPYSAYDERGDNETADGDAGGGGANEQLVVETLTVAIVPENNFLYSPRNIHSLLITQLGDKLAETLLEQGIQLELVLEEIDKRNWSDAQVQFRTRLMAGAGPDMFMVHMHPLYAFMRNGFLVDIYELIDNDPVKQRNDFFENALGAFEYQGQLVAMPMLFSVQLIGINNALPQSITEDFLALDKITLREMARIFDRLQLDYPAFSHMHPINFIMPHDVVPIALSHYLDVPAGTVDMDIDEFASLLEDIRSLIDSLIFQQFFSWQSTFVPTYFTDTWVFSNHSTGLSHAQALMPVDSPRKFTHHIPLANEGGSLVLASSSWGFGNPSAINPSLFAITSGGNTDRAWELMKLLLYASATNPGTMPLGDQSLETPIMTSLFEERATRNLWDVFDDDSAIRDLAERHFNRIYFTQFDELGDRQNAVSTAVNRLSSYNDMPMVIPPMIPWDLYSETLEYFHRNVITSREAATRMNNRLRLWFME